MRLETSALSSTRCPGRIVCKGEDSARGGDGRPEKQAPERRNRETASIRASEDSALPFPADAVERLIDDGNSNRLPGPKHRHALFAH